MAKIYGALEVAQLEWFTDAGKPAPASYIYRVIYVSDLKQVQVSDGTNWVAFVNTSTNQTLAGDITFTGAQIFSGQHRLSVTTNSSTGAIVALAATTPVIEFTGAVTSIAGIASGASGATVMLVNRSGNSFQVLDEGAGASASNRIRTGAGNITLANNASVLLTYVGDNRWHVVGGSGSGAGAGGAKNYFALSSANANFAQNTVSPWSAATLTLSGGVPTGAPTLTATQMAIATTATNPLLNSESLYNMQLTKSAANAQGQGFISGVLTIDREDVAKVLTGTFSYEVVSGTIDLSGASTQSLEIWVYNVTANQWIQPAGFRGMNQSSGVGQVTFTFQTDGTPANVQYRVAVITAQTSTSAYVVNFNDFRIGPQTVPIVQLRNPAGTIIATGSLTPPSGYLYCDGTAVSRTDYAELFAAIGTTYGVGNGTTTFNIPDLRGIFARGSGTQTIGGISYSTTIGTYQGDQFQGHWHQLSFYREQHPNGSGSTEDQFTSPNTTVTDAVRNAVTDGTNGTPRTGSETRPANVGIAYHICFSSGYVQTSNDTDTRVVAARVYQTSQQNIPNGTIPETKIVNLSTVVVDTHSAWSSANNEYVIPVSGVYEILGGVAYGPNATGTRVSYISTVKGGVTNLYAAASRIGTNTAAEQTLTQMSYIDTFAAGDKVFLSGFQSSGGVLATGANLTSTFLQVKRLSGPSVIAASESVNMLARNASSQSIPNASATVLTNWTKEYDTHAAFNATTGLYTVPVSGKYLITGAALLNNGTLTLGNQFSIQLQKNGVDYQVLAGGFAQANITSPMNISGSCQVSCAAGDVLRFNCFQSMGVARSLHPDGVWTHFSVTRIGN